MDTPVKRVRRFGGMVALATGAALAVAAGGAVVLLWGVVVPWVRGSGPPEFSPTRSAAGLWEDARRLPRWGIWTHDDGFRVGRFGGQEWVESLVASMVSGEGISCAGGHRETALSMITNHVPPEGSELGSFWSDWWEKSREQSQSEWIREGFAKDGRDIGLPPRAEDWPVLVEILGEGSDDAEEATGGFPWEDPRGYNAYRWLRDSGFDPVSYATEAPERLDALQRDGLRAYRDFELAQRSAVPGRLDFAPDDDWGRGLPMSTRPAVLEPRTQGILTAVLAVVFFLGIALARWGWRRRGSKEAVSSVGANSPDSGT